MKKHLRESGMGWKIYISKPILKLLGANPKTMKALFTVKGKTLEITAIKPEEVDNSENLMLRNFGKSGSGWGLYIPNPILELLEINAEVDLIEYEIYEKVLTIKKA